MKNTAAAPTTNLHLHDFAISISAADVPEHVIPELKALLQAKLQRVIDEQMLWADLYVDVAYDGRRDCDRKHS